MVATKKNACMFILVVLVVKHFLDIVDSPTIPSSEPSAAKPPTALSPSRLSSAKEPKTPASLAAVDESPLTVSNLSPVSKTEEPPGNQLLGILLVSNADICCLQQWFCRHAATLEMLAVADGTRPKAISDWVSQICQQHNATSTAVHVLKEDDLNTTQFTDQTIRAPAMTVSGNPVGKWIVIAHADEFWTIDPRAMVRQVDSWKNVIRSKVLTASPCESECRKQVARTASHTPPPKDFDFMSVCNCTFASNAKLADTHFENRFVKWEDGMKWGTQHSLVMPEHIPKNKKRDEMRGGGKAILKNVFCIHCKLHNFAANAISSEKMFANSKLKTGSSRSRSRLARLFWMRAIQNL